MVDPAPAVPDMAGRVFTGVNGKLTLGGVRMVGVGVGRTTATVAGGVNVVSTTGALCRPALITATAAPDCGKGANGFNTRGAAGLGAGLTTGLAAGLVAGVAVVAAGLGVLAIKGILPASTPLPLVVAFGAGLVSGVVDVVDVVGVVGVVESGVVTGAVWVITGSGGATVEFALLIAHHAPTPPTKTAKVVPNNTGVETLGRLRPCFLGGSG